MDSIISVVRHIAQFGAGILLSRGIIDESMTEMVIGLAVSAATLAWFFIQKKKPA